MVKNDDKNTSFSKKRVYDFNGKRIDFSVPRVMGIVNVTPDSFYNAFNTSLPVPPASTSPPLTPSPLFPLSKTERGTGGEVWAEDRHHPSLNLWLKTTEKMLDMGAYIIDIGAVSTRPGAAEVSGEEEKRRLLPVLKKIRKSFPEIIISVDTFRAGIARMAAAEGADIINDISGGTFDPEMIPEIIRLHIPYVIMHMQGTPATMQLNPVYGNVVKEVRDFLLKQAKKLESQGHNKIIIDPGFGFGKSVEHNYKLLSHLDEFVNTGYPVLAGLSRKSMINKVLGTKPAEALNGTTALNTIALMKGAGILRVHDVKEAVETIQLVNETIS